MAPLGHLLPVMLTLLKAIDIYYTLVIFNYTMTIPNFLKMCQWFYYRNIQKFESLSEYFCAPENYYSWILSYFAPHSPTTAMVGKRTSCLKSQSTLWTYGLLSYRSYSQFLNVFLATTVMPQLTLILLMWRIGWAHNNTSNWQMGFNSAFEGLRPISFVYSETEMSKIPTSFSSKFNILQFKKYKQ